MKTAFTFVLLLLCSTIFAQLEIWKQNVDSLTIKPKHEIWTLTVDSVTMIRDGQSPTKIVKPEYALSFNTDANLLDIWNPYHTEYRFFALDTISEFDKGKETHCIKWEANGQRNPGNVPSGQRTDIPNCRISFSYYPESKRVEIFLNSRGISYYYYTLIKENKSSKPKARKFSL